MFLPFPVEPFFYLFSNTLCPQYTQTHTHTHTHPIALHMEAFESVKRT